MGDFMVQNCGNKTSFTFCIPSFEKREDWIHRANQVNSRNAKFNGK